MQMNFINRSISVEVSKFLSRFHFSGKEKDVSKQAFSKARSKIKWEGFRYLNDEMIKQYYSDQDYIHYKNKYLVIATDGTTYELPYEEKLIAEFNEWDNGQTIQPICMAQGLKLYDVLNHMTIISNLEPYSAGQEKGISERESFEKSLAKLPQLIDNQSHNVLFLGDKYYPSFYKLHQLPFLGYNFVFRCKANFCKEVKAFVDNKSNDAVLKIDLEYDRRKYQSSAKRIDDMPAYLEVRCVKIKLANGDMEYLLTNVNKEELNIQDLKELYGFRWNEETSFDTDKNKLEVENISSKTPNGVRQDFYAKVLTANITQLLISEAQMKLEEEQAQKNNKHTYQINRAVATGLVKDELPKLFLGQESAQVWYPRMVGKILRRREPVRKHRVYPKKRKHKLKFSITKRRVL